MATAGYGETLYKDDPSFWLSLIYRDDKEKIELLQKQLLLGGIHHGPHRLRLRHRKGYPVEIELWLIPVYQEGSSLIAVEAIARDITDQEKMERELLARNRELEVLNQIAFSDGAAVSMGSFLSFSLEILLSVSEASEGGIYLLEGDGPVLQVCSNGFDAGSAMEIMRRENPTIEGEIFMGLRGDPPINWVIIPLKELSHCTGYFVLAGIPDNLANGESKKLFDRASNGVGDALLRKRVEERLRLSEERFLGITESIDDGYYETDIGGSFTFLNRAFCAMLGFSRDELMSRRIGDLCPEQEKWKVNGKGVLWSAQGDKWFTLTLLARGGPLSVDISLIPIRDGDGTIQGQRGLVRDTNGKRRQDDLQKAAEERANYLERHDYLTGLLNRFSFEQAMQEFDKKEFFPVSIITCDIDGLKLINDSLGHGAGDKLLRVVGEIIKKIVQSPAVAARIGGDEFAALFPACFAKDVESCREKILEYVEKYNRRFAGIPLSLSTGVATAGSVLQSSTDVFRHADNSMYSDKLLRCAGARSTIVRALMVTLAERDFITGGHAARLQEMVTMLGKAAGLQPHELNDLILLSQVHDIGKVGIPDSILFKPGKLTPSEWENMKKHSEIGYRIAKSSPELAPIAEMILQHHEWWNGKGYPRGLKGEDIHICSRILAIVDAFDAMTNKRPYREPSSLQEAFLELKRCKGSQFDPLLVDLFFKCLDGNHL